MRPEFYEIRGWRMACLLPLAALLRLWFMTFRIEMPPEIRARLKSESEGIIFILWHNRVFGTNEIHRRFRKCHGHRLVGLFSGSRDGAWLAALFRLLGMGAVRGSQNRRGAAGAREMLGVIANGFDTGLTVDGSRGPVYEAKEGAAMIARRTGAPILFISPTYHHAWRFKSWDRFFLPKPFCRIEVKGEFYENIEALCPGADRKAATAAITAMLNELGRGSDPELGL